MTKPKKRIRVPAKAVWAMRYGSRNDMSGIRLYSKRPTPRRVKDFYGYYRWEAVETSITSICDTGFKSVMGFMPPFGRPFKLKVGG